MACRSTYQELKLAWQEVATCVYLARHVNDYVLRQHSRTLTQCAELTLEPGVQDWHLDVSECAQAPSLAPNRAPENLFDKITMIAVNLKIATTCSGSAVAER